MNESQIDINKKTAHLLCFKEITVIPENVIEYNNFRFLKNNDLNEKWGKEKKLPFNIYIHFSEYQKIIDKISKAKNIELIYKQEIDKIENEFVENIIGEKMYKLKVKLSKNEFMEMRRYFLNNKKCIITCDGMYLFCKKDNNFHITVYNARIQNYSNDEKYTEPELKIRHQPKNLNIDYEIKKETINNQEIVIDI